MATSSKYTFKKYKLSTTEIQKLAGAAMREQGSVDGARAELSLMANKFEAQSKWSNICNYVYECKWWSSNSFTSTSDKKWTNLVVDVLIKGNRTLPLYINEHDCINPPDITSTTNDGVSFSTTNRAKYKQGTTIIKNKYGSTYTFWCFPASGSDPFGTTQPKKLKEWLKKYGVKGELYYQTSTIAGVTSSYEGEVDVSTLIQADQLYSSENYKYLETTASKAREQEEYFKKSQGIKSSFKDLIATVYKNHSETDDTAFASFAKTVISDYVLTRFGVELTPVISKTMVSGNISGYPLPVVNTPVEAPVFEVSLGSVTFGGYHNRKIPNYVSSLRVKKINGSINEYTITLIHQIYPGDNPNYIDEVLSSVGYDIINIKYGEASQANYFTDAKAIITDVTQNFDFSGCKITYIISAVSLSATFQAARFTYEGFTGKISDRIKELLYEDKTSGFAQAFTGMADRALIEEKGFIPDNDKEVTVGTITASTPVEYLNWLVNRMEPDSTKLASSAFNTSANAIYRTYTTDTALGAQFVIKLVTADIPQVPFMYEVNIGYPDDSFVLDFNVTDNFAWAIAYEGSADIVRYDYNINSSGNLIQQRIPAVYQNEDDKLGSRNLWSSLTRFPVNATLTIRGLLQDTMLLQYIKINNYVYGAKRITSGVYVVTEQEDVIGNGIYASKLSLTRVAGDEEFINLDAKIRTEWAGEKYEMNKLKYEPYKEKIEKEAQAGKKWVDGGDSPLERTRPATK